MDTNLRKNLNSLYICYMEKSQFEEKVKLFGAEECKIRQKEPLIVAVSGGADSVALLVALCELGYDCVMAHCNFHLRGEESNRDECFVKSLSEQMKLTLEVVHFDVEKYEREHKVSTEMACRELRYEWFERLRKQYDAQAIAVAHHKDDAIETFFLNAMRGSGVQGLASISPVSGRVVRPLLCVGRGEIECYLQQKDMCFVEDSTNKENDFKRNKVRNLILPALYEQFPEAETGLLRTLHDMRGAALLYAELVQKCKKDMCRGEDNCIKIDNKSLLAMKGGPTMLFEILKDYGFNSSQTRDVWAAIGKSGKKFYAENYLVSVERTELAVMPISGNGDESFLVDFNEKGCGHLPISLEASLEASLENESFSVGSVDGKSSVALSADILQAENVVLRHWRKGDRFRPFGLKGSKLLSDYFTDMKFSEAEKQNVWILEADGQIVWIVGYRASSAYAVKKRDEKYLKLIYKNNTI